jgi:antitoxin (DNA-binding transcriptional repressor) of toxin-antitoxin stability system
MEDVQVALPQVLDKLTPGNEIIITRDEQPVAQLVPWNAPAPRPQFGSCRDMLTIVVDDDAHLADFKEYMP